MFIAHHQNNATILFEFRLCCVCGRMFNLNSARYHHFVKEQMIFYAHERCPEQKEIPYQLRRS